ncbi:FAD dependent oxidoreductase [Emticicia oligotrophica DSM 17448]|uniref:FAD dependent oxidoreductase n=1 Tax=Emticicia oligotrophica (strain DSM 17448 / CIP 109782 / MTCC 6937 / GPTSA100-15) TaxID=929562 RepID=A0ABM5N5X8_EMTOG|nr:FAD-binding oxidoreductase [Emticicia oligotrophica]AFK04921.1 FAD dependent oxidoreductase [Emticicia oligotrophica DSM 17448]
MLSFWEKDVFLKKYDVIIVGAGFSGLWLAFFLKKQNPKIQIAILERGVLPTGASTKNAGFSCFGSPTELLENIAVMGVDEAMFLAEQRFRGIKMIEQYFGSEIEFDACGGTELFINDGVFDDTIHKIDYLNDSIKRIVGNENHFYVDKNIIGNAGFYGFESAITNSVEGSIHSGKLVNVMIESLQDLKVKFFFGVEVDSFEENSGEVCIKTKNNLTFLSKHLCFTTNAFTKQLLPDIDLYPGRGQVLITEPIEGLNWSGTFHFDKGFYYFRNYQNRVLLGGGRNLNFTLENTDEFGITSLIQEKLEELLFKNIIPNFKQTKIDYRWSGIMAFDETKTPVCKMLSNQVSLSVRMNGMGVALAPTLSELLAKQITEVLQY